MFSELAVGNDLFCRFGGAKTVREYVDRLRADPALAEIYAFNLAFARRRWCRERLDRPTRVAICGWELSHNAAGRVRTLADLWRPLAETEIIGATFPRWGDALWAPIRDSEFPCHMIHVADEASFPRQALEHVLAHPYDIVHLSKPRFPNIFFGLLYKLIWDARVILDIDDEELGANNGETPISIEALLEKHGDELRWQRITGKDWTRAAVGLWDIFDGTTVSNAALQARYQGAVIPHARAAKDFTPSLELRRASRDRFGIPQDKTVVLFFGTPRRHKGLLETAEAIAALRRDDLCYVIVGDFPDPTLREELAAIEGADIRFLPSQPYGNIAKVVALGDICVLLQRDTSLLASYQLPAKMIDALAMGLLVLAQPTPALMQTIKAGAVAEIFPNNLKETLARWIDDPEAMRAVQASGRSYFLNHLEADQARGSLAEFLKKERPLPAPDILLQRTEQNQLFKQLGRWKMFSAPVTAKSGNLKKPDNAGNGTDPILFQPTPDALPASNSAEARIVVYSVLVGSYESVKEPEAIDPAARYILFTDNPDLKSEKWEVVQFDTLGLSPRRASRLPKLLPHRYLPEHDVSVYLDSSLTITEPDIKSEVATVLHGVDLAAYPHFERNCVFDEIEECLSTGKANPEKSKALRDRLKKEQFPSNWGLLENAFLVRRNTPLMRQINELWFMEYIRGPERDQFSLMYVLWRAEVPYAVIENARNFRKSPHLRWTKHYGASTCVTQPEPAHVTEKFDFLKKIRPSALIANAKKEISKIDVERQKGRYPAIPRKRVLNVISALNWLNLQRHPEADKLTQDLARALYGDVGQIALGRGEAGLKLAYIAGSSMPSIAANNVHVMKICSAFAELGVDVTLYADREPDYTGTDVTELHVRFGTRTQFPIVLLNKSDPEATGLPFHSILGKAAMDGCTVIFTRSLNVAVDAVLAGVPVYLEIHEIKDEVSSGRIQFLSRQPLLRKIVVISQPLKSLLTGFVRGIESKVEVLHDAADPVPENLSTFPLADESRFAANLGYVGHLYPGKGAELCHELAQRMPDVGFHMLGGRPEDVQMWKEKTAHLPNLIFYGHRPAADVPSFIASLDICIAPFLRRVEAMGRKRNIADVFSPLKIFEYMAHGKPIITSDLPVLREVLTHDRTALLCDPDDPMTFVSGIRRLLAEPETARQLGAAAQAQFNAHYTWPRRANRIMDLINAQDSADAAQIRSPKRGSGNETKPRIVFTIGKGLYTQTGGSQKSVCEVASLFASDGFPTHILFEEKSIPEGASPRFALHPNVEIVNVLDWKDGMARRGKQARSTAWGEVLKEAQPDVAIIWMVGGQPLIVQEHLHSSGVPFICAHRQDPHYDILCEPSRDPVRLRRVQEIIHRAAVHAVQTPAYMDFFKPKIRANVMLTPNVVTPPDPLMQASVHETAQRNIVLNVARLHAQKNQQLLIEAFAKIADRFPDWDVHVYGDGPEEENLRGLIASLGLEDRVLLKGVVHDLSAAYMQARLFAFPSIFEGFSRAHSEAMSFGLPSLGLETCASSLWLIGESGGGQLTRNDPTEFAQALNDMMLDPQGLKKMGKKAASYVARFRADEVYKAWLKTVARARQDVEVLPTGKHDAD